MAARDSSRGTRRNGRVRGNHPRAHPSRPRRPQRHSERRRKLHSKVGRQFAELREITARFLDALALVTVAFRSLEAREPLVTSEEVTVFGTGLAALSSVYNELDAIESALSRACK